MLLAHVATAVSLHCCFKISNKLPDPDGPLSKEVKAKVIKAANDNVEWAAKNIGASGKFKAEESIYDFHRSATTNGQTQLKNWHVW